MNTDQEFAEKYSMYMYRQGIPKRYHKKPLSAYGPVGTYLKGIFSDKETWETYFKNKPILNLVNKEGIREQELLFAVARTFLIYNQKVVVKRLQDLILASDNDFADWLQNKVICINNFYHSQIENFISPGHQYTIEDFVVNCVMEDKILIISSDATLDKFDWYSKKNNSFMREYGEDLLL